MRTWLRAAVIGGGLLFVVVAAASVGSGDGRTRVWAVASAASGEPGQPGAPGGTGQPGQPGEPGAPGQRSSSGASVVSCSGNSCEVTLAGNATVHVQGATFSIQEIRDGRATLRVQEENVSGAAGQTVSAGSLTIRFTAVTEDSVSFTTSLD
jgi:hypothetical protein